MLIDTVTVHGSCMGGTWKYDGGQVEQLVDPQPAKEIPGIYVSELLTIVPAGRNSGN